LLKICFHLSRDEKKKQGQVISLVVSARCFRRSTSFHFDLIHTWWNCWSRLTGAEAACGGIDAPSTASGAGRSRGRVANPLRKTRGLSASVLDAAYKENPRSEEHTSELQSRENLVCR